jgi:TusA-related sulfurtransferase
MEEQLNSDKKLDLKGLPCPMPIVKVSKGIKDIKIGQVLKAVTTDPGSLNDFPAWARSSGNEILDTQIEGEEITFYIQRSA